MNSLTKDEKSEAVKILNKDLTMITFFIIKEQKEFVKIVTKKV